MKSIFSQVSFPIPFKLGVKNPLRAIITTSRPKYKPHEKNHDHKALKIKELLISTTSLSLVFVSILDIYQDRYFLNNLNAFDVEQQDIPDLCL